MDGNIVIGTKINTHGLETGLKEIEDQAKNIDDIDIGVDAEEVETLYDVYKKVYEGVTYGSKEWQEITDNILDNMEGTAEWQAVMLKGLGELADEYKTINSMPIMTDEDIERAEELKQGMLDIAKQWKEVTGETIHFKGALKDINSSASGIEDRMKNIENSISNFGKSMLKTGLAMLGIQSIASTLRESFNRIKDGHSELQAAIDHIKGIIDVIVDHVVTTIEPLLPKLIPMIEKIATMAMKIADIAMTILVPVLEWFIDAIKWLADAVADIVYYLSFGLVDFRTTDQEVKNLSVNADNFAENMNKSAEATKETKKQAQQLKKQLMGFDEMNVLNDNGSVGSLTTTPSSTNNTNNTTVAKEFFGNFKEAVQENVSEGTENGIKDGINAVTERDISQIGTLPIVGIDINWEGIFSGDGNSTIDKFFSKDMKKILYGGILDDKASKSDNKDFKSFAKWLKILGNGAKTYTATYEDGMYKIKIATGQTFKLTEEELHYAEQYINASGGRIKKDAEDLIAGIGTLGDKLFGDLNKGTNETKKNIETSMSSVSGSLTTAGQSFANEIEKLLGGTGTKANKSKKDVEKAYSGIGSTLTTAGQSFADAISSSLDVLPDECDEAVSESKGTLGNLIDWLDHLLNDKITPKFNTIGEVIGKGVGGAVASGVNGILPIIEKTMNNNIDEINKKNKEINKGWANLGLAVLNTGRGLAEITHLKLGKVKFLAKGGIINQPGRGVYVGGAIAGERGREGIVPLDDTRQMQLLGQEIAKNIVINLTNVTSLDGRQIARTTARVMNDMQFASNGGVI